MSRDENRNRSWAAENDELRAELADMQKQLYDLHKRLAVVEAARPDGDLGRRVAFLERLQNIRHQPKGAA